MDDDRLIDQWRMDKTVFSVGNLYDPPDEREYWWSKTPEERLEAAEFMRQVTFGYDPTTERLQRILTVARLGEG